MITHLDEDGNKETMYGSMDICTGEDFERVGMLEEYHSYLPIWENSMLCLKFDDDDAELLNSAIYENYKEM